MWLGFELENGPPGAHIPGMAQTASPKLLEVTVIGRNSHSWEWQVHAGNEIVVLGYENTRLGARFAGNDAMFLMLASGWNP